MADTWLTPEGDMVRVGRHLGITEARLLSDEALRDDVELCVAAALSELEDRIGPVIEVEVTQYVPTAAPSVALKYRPVEITEWEGADVLTIRLGDVLPDGSRPQVVHAATGTTLPAGTVTYTAGWAADETLVPAWARLTAMILAKHLWSTQLGNQRAAAETPGSAWLWPRQAEHLVNGHELAPGGFA